MGRTNSHGLPRGISTNPNGSYRARVTYEGRQYTIGTYVGVSYAKAALDIARGQMARGTFVPPNVRLQQRKQAEAERLAQQLTVREWSATWLQRLKAADRSPSTLASYDSTLNAHILDLLGDMRLADVTQDHVDGLCSGTTPAVRRNILRTLSAMFNAAVKAGMGGITESPVTAEVGRMPRRSVGDLPNWEGVRLLADAMPERLRASVWIAATLGLRLGEVLGLQRQDLDLDDPEKAVAHIRRQWLTKAKPPTYGPPKDDSRRTLAIPAVVVPMLVTHLERFAANADNAPVFPSTVDKLKPVSQGALDRVWQEARKSAGFPQLHFHDLRHLGLTMYRRAGGNERDTMNRGGHTDAKSALIYQESDLERDRELTAKLNSQIIKVL
ncbi:MAG: tyrosine-type recombinase/integrase [Propionicimonas sp.]|uniref:tyrosine-type recombinase/integrase n=1 Tax=Propionicimonas sp. TaxID=1955623 RepID=UPI002B1F0FDC|nr:tyrosine-type recombinase/integrase [Propionicimonas sp.]MEA4945708.1 tyrosine-type recombinase/integrase [Propionicimonas sp.]